MAELKIYRIGQLTFQFLEGEQPAGAVEVAAKKKAVRPANKARTTRATKKADDN